MPCGNEWQALDGLGAVKENKSIMTQGQECKEAAKEVCVFVLKTREKEREGAEGVTRQLGLGFAAPGDVLYPAD